ncbi:MAG: pyridoxal phosphate-dependent aminotransferase [Clostridia bacterium]|nr:pyridoxal phosphate-dependent aminotransferase [Clostridia bacterium]
MINKKMYELGAKRSEIRELFEYGLRRKAEIGAENVFDFSLGNPSVPAPDSVTEGLQKLVSEVSPETLHAYTSAAGDVTVRAAIADYINKNEGTDYGAESLYMTMGAAAALTASLTALVGEGEEVIVLAPYFPEYKVFIERTGAIVREVPSDNLTFQPDIDAIKATLNEKTAAIIINSPNNPTGTVITEESVIALAEALKDAEDRYSKPIYIIADEPYRELVYGGVKVPFLPKYYRDTVVCYSYSKSLSLPGERIGYVLVPPTVSDSGSVYLAIAGAGRALGFVCAPSMLQRLIPFCLGDTSDISVYDRNRRLLLEELTSYGFTLVKPDGAFYLFMKTPCPSAKEFAEVAKKFELLLVPSDSFGCGGYVRISYCVTTEQIERALPAFKRLAEEYGLGRGK